MLSVVVGRAIHHGMATNNICLQERQCQYWLNSVLVQNGIEEREKLRGQFLLDTNFFGKCYATSLFCKIDSLINKNKSGVARY